MTQFKDRELRELALDMAIRSREAEEPAAETVAAAEVFLAFLKGVRQ